MPGLKTQIQMMTKYFNILHRIKGDSSKFFTGCLNDFSLYVFHPYGAGRKQRPEDMVFSPLTSEERKDSLSVHVAFVKFHLSRSRRYIFRPRTAASLWALWSLGPNKPQGVGIRRYMAICPLINHTQIIFPSKLTWLDWRKLGAISENQSYVIKSPP